MSSAAQKRAVRRYRSRLTRRGLTRFEVKALSSDRELLRVLARRLAEASPQSSKVRTLLQQAVSVEEAPKVGGILDALRRSPLVGSGLKLRRSREDEGREPFIK